MLLCFIYNVYGIEFVYYIEHKMKTQLLYIILKIEIAPYDRLIGYCAKLKWNMRKV